jgi:hypothetical protein
MNQTTFRFGWPASVISAGILLAAACEPIDERGAAPDPALATAELQDASVPVYLNHAFTVVPRATYQALRDSQWLNSEFSSVQERTTVRPDITYTGVYMLFERTYLELFEVGPAFPVEAGALALSDETAGGMAWATDRMVEVFGQDKVVTGTISRTVDGQPVPWFHFAFPDGVFSDLFSTWNMEFVTKPGATSPPTRQESLAAIYDPGKLAKNVVAVAYALPPADGQNLRTLLAALDWSASEADEDGSFVALSPVDAGVRRAVVVEPATATCTGITALGIALHRHADHVEEMGGARLVAGILGKKLAILWLRPSGCSDQIEEVLGGLGE